jgi:predicted ATP-grasp superfamily ATP-dependent carboligase
MIGILYEHRQWFEPLFAEFERRKVPFDRIFIRDHHYDPAERHCPYSLIVNRISAYPSGGSHPGIILYVKQYLRYLESIGARVINGYHSYLVGTSKAMQLDIFEHLGLRYPRARVIHDPGQAVQAAAGLSFPVVVKPNVGGSGTGILKFGNQEELELAVRTEALDLGIDHTALVQEFLQAKGKTIVRVELLDGEFLYALRLPTTEASFNYCPADGCNVANPELAVESHRPPEQVIEEVQNILAAAQADLGSVEYLICENDDQVYYYDINPLSNFVADAPRVVGFDPFVRFVDFVLARAGL